MWPRAVAPLITITTTGVGGILLGHGNGHWPRIASITTRSANVMASDSNTRQARSEWVGDNSIIDSRTNNDGKKLIRFLPAAYTTTTMTTSVALDEEADECENIDDKDEEERTLEKTVTITEGGLLGMVAAYELARRAQRQGIRRLIAHCTDEHFVEVMRNQFVGEWRAGKFEGRTNAKVMRALSDMLDKIEVQFECAPPTNEDEEETHRLNQYDYYSRYCGEQLESLSKASSPAYDEEQRVANDDDDYNDEDDEGTYSY